MNWADVLRAAGAFFLVLVALALTYALVRLAALLERATEAVAALRAEGLPALAKANALLDQSLAQMGKVDAMLDTAGNGVQSADATVRRVAGVVEAPFAKLGEAGAFVSGSVSSFRARRAERREG